MEPLVLSSEQFKLMYQIFKASSAAIEIHVKTTDDDFFALQEMIDALPTHITVKHIQITTPLLTNVKYKIG